MKRPDGGNPGFAPDLFGAGKNGFKDDPMDPPATQLDAAMFNNIVESLCRLVENSGQTLDGLNFDQVWLAVTNAVLTDPTISNGGSLTLEDSSMLVVEADGGNGGSSISFAGAGAAAQWQSGSTLQTVIGAVVQLLGSVTIGTTAAQTLSVNSLAEFNENVTLADTKTLTLTSTASIVGGASASVSAGTVDTLSADGVVSTGELAFYSDATPSGTTGVMQFAGRYLAIGFGGTAETISIPREDWVSTASTVNAIDNTGASVTVTLLQDDVVFAELDMESENTSALNDINVRIEVNGSPVGGTQAYRPAAANRAVAVRRVIQFTAPSTQAYTFTARHGASAGTTTSNNIRMLVRFATQP